MIVAGFVWRADSIAPERSLARAWALRGELGDDRPIGLALGWFSDDARILGRWIENAEPGLRRASGGPTIVAPAGTIHVALGLRDASLLLDTPADKLLNRNVRGILRGLGAQYFGRELISVGPDPIGVLGWARDRERRVLIEAFIGVDAPVKIVACDRDRDPLRGRSPSCLRAVGRSDTPGQLLDRLIDAHARLGHGAAFEPSRAVIAGQIDELRPEVCWTATVDASIGRVMLGRDRNGMLHLGGEAFADDDFCEWLDDALARFESSDVVNWMIAEGRIEGLSRTELRTWIDQLAARSPPGSA